MAAGHMSTITDTRVETASAAEARRVAMASAIGTTIEWYDFFIYGTAAAVVFGPQFFPQVSELAGRIASFATFAIGFITRPLGGVVMGHFGDRLGRKSMLIWSLMLMGLSTFAIGLLPTYSRIGVWAPLLLVLLRFIQGFALGGEWGGAVLMSVEHAPQGRRGLFGSFVALGLPIGIILSNLVFLITSLYVAPAQFAAWAWRIPFLASGVLVAIGLFVRLRIAESPFFEALQRSRAERRMPVLDVLRSHGTTVLLAAGSYASASALGYIAIVYFVSYATRELHMPLTTALALLLTSAVIFAMSILVAATLSDRVGRRRMMMTGLGALAVWSLIFFPLIDTRSVPLMAVALCGMLLLQGLYIGPQPAVFSELFPTAVRYSGASLSLTLGTIIGGALAPAIATTLFGMTKSSWPITVYLTMVAVVSWLCAWRLRETHLVPLGER
jgi:metabolite-proton symporter